MYARPRTPFVAESLGAATLLRGVAQPDGTLMAAGHRVPLALPSEVAGRTVRVAVRPESIALAAEGTPGALRAAVVESAYLGHAWRIVARVADGLDITAHAPCAVALGEVVWILPRSGRVVEVEE